jgi:hypothetical protein
MDLPSALALKQQLVDEIQDPGNPLYVENFRPGKRYFDSLPKKAGIALGVTDLRVEGGYGIAIRVQEDTDEMWDLAHKIDRMARGESDFQKILKVRGQALTVHSVVPLCAGLPIGHSRATDGTLGAFVVVTSDNDHRVYVLSNNHVIAALNRAHIGDPILQPGRGDGGRPSRNRIGELASFEELRNWGGPNEIDAALCALDSSHVDLASNPIGAVDPQLGDVVEKRGITGSSQGTVTAIAVDVLAVEYPNLTGRRRTRPGYLRFDKVFEIQGSEGPFSAEGDSGSLICKCGTEEAIGLLFAGRQRGKGRGIGVSYACPILKVLDAMTAKLAEPEQR